MYCMYHVWQYMSPYMIEESTVRIVVRAEEIQSTGSMNAPGTFRLGSTWA